MAICHLEQLGELLVSNGRPACVLLGRPNDTKTLSGLLGGTQ